MKTSALALALALSVPSVMASPWTSLGPLNGLTTLPNAQRCQHRIVNHFVNPKQILVPSLTKADSSNVTFVFNPDLETLSLWAAGGPAFKNAIAAFADLTTMADPAMPGPPPTPAPAPPGDFLMRLPDGTAVWVKGPPPGYRLEQRGNGFVYVQITPPAGQPAVVMSAVVQPAPLLPAPPGPQVPVATKQLSLEVTAGQSPSVTFSIKFTDRASGVVQGRGFGVDRTLLNRFEVQESCPL
jgi:hypothetical protein